MCPAGEFPDLPENQGRDLNRKHYDSWGTLVGKNRELSVTPVAPATITPPLTKLGPGTAMVTQS